jgi:OOP family OmpA-OmpF porin
MKMKHLITATLLASVTSVAFAQSSTTYFGISGGEAKAKSAPDLYGVTGINPDAINSIINNLNQLPGYTASSSFANDRTDTAYKIYLGFKSTENFALEFGYANFGKFSSSGQASADYVDGPDTAFLSTTANLESKNTAWFLDAVGTVPMSEKFSLVGRVGAAYVKTRSTLSDSYAYEYDIEGDPYDADSGSGSSSRSKSKWVPKVGIGVAYQISQGVSALVEYERYFSVGDSSVGFKSDVDMLTAGLKFHF